MSSASYLPVAEAAAGGGNDKSSGEGPLSPRMDPLYAALLSGDIGSVAGGEVGSESPGNTLDESVATSVVCGTAPMHGCSALLRGRDGTWT